MNESIVARRNRENLLAASGELRSLATRFAAHAANLAEDAHQLDRLWALLQKPSSGVG